MSRHTGRDLHRAEDRPRQATLVQKRCRDPADGRDSSVVQARGVELVQARGSFLNSNTLQLTAPDGTQSQLTFDHCIVAVGSRPAMPPVFNIGDPRVMDSTGALALADIPRRLLVIGGRVISAWRWARSTQPWARRSLSWRLCRFCSQLRIAIWWLRCRSGWLGCSPRST